MHVLHATSLITNDLLIELSANSTQYLHMYKINLYISEVGQSVVLPSGHARHFSDRRNIHKGAKVVHGNRSNKHDNLSDKLPSIDTSYYY